MAPVLSAPVLPWLLTAVVRIALEDFEYQGNTIRHGQIVQLSIASANRDAAHFPDPDRFDIRRTPGQILSFGYGPHGCLGGHPARHETRIALDLQDLLAWAAG